MAQDLCLIGSIVAVHGIRGAVKVQSHSDVPGRFTRLARVYLGATTDSVQSARVISVSGDDLRPILAFEGHETREDAERLIGFDIYIDAADMAAPPPGRHFIHDLIGCTVRTASGDERGTVRDVMLFPANDVYVVDWNGVEVLVPAVPAIVLSVDTARKTIIVEAVPGLFEDPDAD